MELAVALILLVVGFIMERSRPADVRVRIETHRNRR
jgi:hypothetical protein